VHFATGVAWQNSAGEKENKVARGSTPCAFIPGEPKMNNNILK
jgi:hypothetical protein